MQLMVRNIILMFISNDDPVIRLYIGDFVYLSGTEKEVCILPITVSIISILSLLLNWINYKNGVLPVDRDLFDMLSGLMKPKMIGVFDKIFCEKLLIITRKAFFAAKCVENSVFVIFFLLCITFSIKMLTNFELILIAIYNAMIWSIAAHYIYTFIAYQTLYYYIITYYLKRKLNILNENLKLIIKSNKYIGCSNILYIIDNYYKIHDNIHIFNTNYWSKFLCIIWFNITFIITIIMYLLLFFENNLMKIL